MARIIHTEDINRKRLIVTILTIGSIILLTGLMITQLHSLYYTSSYKGISFYFIPLLLLAHIGMLMLIKRGRITAVSFVLIGIHACGSLFGAYTWGVSMPATLLMFSLVIGISGILISNKFGLYTTIVIFICMIVLGLHEIKTPEISAWKQNDIHIADIVAYIIILGISSGLSLLSNREIEKSLNRALESEKNLEEKVDIRTRELKESQLQTLAEVSKTAELGKMAQGLFHDLINPLTSVALYVEEYDAKQTKEYIQKAIQATNRMRRMLDVTRSQLKNGERKEEFSVYNEILIVKDLLAYRARKKEVSIHISGNKNTLLYGSPLRFNQIVSNIIQNAIEAFDQEKDKKITIEIDETTINISNNGPKIKDTEIARIFETSYSTKENHLGIGLPTVAHIIKEEFTGTITVESTPHFTTFILTFPNGKIPPPFSPLIQNHHV